MWTWPYKGLLCTAFVFLFIEEVFLKGDLEVSIPSMFSLIRLMIHWLMEAYIEDAGHIKPIRENPTYIMD